MWGAGSPCRGSPRAAGRGWARDLCRGEIEFGGSGKKRGKFVKVPSGVAPSVLFDLLLAEWQLPVPNLVVSLAGEERPFAVRSWLRDVLRKGLVKAAQSTGEAPPGPDGRHSPEPVPRPHSPQTLPGASLPAACSGSSLGDAAEGGAGVPPPWEAQPTLRASPPGAVGGPPLAKDPAHIPPQGPLRFLCWLGALVPFPRALRVPRAHSEEALLRTVPEGLQELDGLDSERSLLCSPGSRRDALTGAPRARGDRGPRAAFLLTRWRMFWGAPVTVFLGNVVMYFAFLFLFTYVLLVDFRPPPRGPSGPEVTLYFWVFTLVLEEIRQGFFTDEDTSLVKKLTLYVEDHWNKCDMVAIFLFVIGVTCRMLPSVFEAGRAVLAVDFMVFTLRLIHIFAIHKQLGPKIIIVERMMKDVFFFLFFLSVWLVAYGVTTQALLHPHDGRLEWVFRRVLYRPYLQIFGQIPLDEIDEARVNCSLHPLLQEGSASCPNLYANWLVILLLVTFLLVTNVLLMNLLIAMFSYTFQVVQGNADMFWKFQRYHLIAEYHERPALAPPFILLSHLSLALKRLFQKGAEQRRARLERDLAEPLDQKVVTWETVQKENYLSRLERHRKDSEEEVLRKTAHRVDIMAKYLGGLREQEKRLKHLESQVDYCTALLSSMAQGGSYPIMSYLSLPRARPTGHPAAEGSSFLTRLSEHRRRTPASLCRAQRGRGQRGAPRGWPAALRHLSMWTVGAPGPPLPEPRPGPLAQTRMGRRERGP
ncbi:transient receptor potential cation channel subfamily M member 5 [Herpailurus yagouaroundi]|uniref:transient receptor potential cation channel subfamily M member 5 n=1 Tax=Herpailurus yagouaroundi TaxID=1608482 RepID=UPI001AD77FA7|nr:transient receptor potential cation channel subfamily M member 5 [Puma yagouaroundi]